MTFTVKNTKGKKVRIYDAQGKEFPMVYSYNSKTRTVSFFLTAPKEKGSKARMVLTRLAKKQPKYGGIRFEPLKIKVKVPGSYIVVDGERF